MQRANEIRFDGWTLRLDSGELTRGKATVRLQAQPLHVLQALLEHPGEVVAREDLVARLWPKGIVDFDTALNSAVRRLRHALDDIADAPRYIETIPRRGYRFIGTVDAPAPERIGGAVARIASSREPLIRSAALGAAVLLALANLGLGHDSRTPGAEAVLSARAGNLVSNASREGGFAALRYREARYFYQRRAPGDLERARKRFEQALELDPDFGEAQAGLASTYFVMTMQGEIEREIGFDRVRAAAERAIALDPAIAEAHYRLAMTARFTGDPREADAEWRRATSLEPSGAMALGTRASIAMSEGRIEESVELSRKAVVAEPLTIVYRYNLAVALFFSGRIEEAKQVNLEVLELSPDFASDIAAMAMILQHEFEPALALILRWPDGPLRQECLALAYYGLDRVTQGDDSLAALIRSAGTDDPLRIVEVYAYRGDDGAAFRWLDAATVLFREPRTREHASIQPWMLRFSPLVASLRGTPRWNAWIGTLDAESPPTGK